LEFGFLKVWNLIMIRSYFPLFVPIFYFLKKKVKGFPLLSGLGQWPSEEH